MNGSSQFNVKANVRISMIDKFGNKYDEFIGSNRVTKLALEGLVKFINGEFNSTVPNLDSAMNNYIPSYVAFGSNILTEQKYTTIENRVNVTDYSLLEEYKDANNNNMRYKISSSNIQNINNNPYIKLILRCYISSESLDNKPIREVGLFSMNKGNNCWARIVLPNELTKTEGSVVDVTWELTLVSVDSQNTKYGNYKKQFDNSTKHLCYLVELSNDYDNSDYYSNNSIELSNWYNFHISKYRGRSILNYIINDGYEYYNQLTSTGCKDCGIGPVSLLKDIISEMESSLTSIGINVDPNGSLDPNNL